MADLTEWKRKKALRDKASPLVVDLLLQKGVYSSITIGDETEKEAERLIRDAQVGTFDCYCTTCNQVTPFISQNIEVKNAGGGLRHGDALLYPPSVFALRTVCQRCLAAYLYAFQKVGDQVIKIGQLPSMSDISFGELKGIDRSLEPADRKELGTALGLFSHDAAAGAFVYLRRVFERMIDRAHRRQGAPVEGFREKRMDERIEAIKQVLPERVVTNRRVFAVLSRGVHELTDDQCKSLFPLVKAVIFQMLEQEEHHRRKELSEKETDAALKALLAAGITMEEGSAAPALPSPGSTD